MEAHYVKLQQKMNEKYGLVKVQKDTFEKEQKEIKDRIKIDGEILSLNIGGTHHISTEQSVLQSVPGSELCKVFSGTHELKKKDDEIFLDRDGTAFETLVNYLRNERKVFPEFSDKNSENMFYKELHHWGIDQEHREWQEEYLRRLDKNTYRGSAQASAMTQYPVPRQAGAPAQSHTICTTFSHTPQGRYSGVQQSRLEQDNARMAGSKFFDPKEHQDPGLGGQPGTR